MATLKKHTHTLSNTPGQIREQFWNPWGILATNRGFIFKSIEYKLLLTKLLKTTVLYI